MTIYWVASEDSDIAAVGSASVTTSGGRFRSGMRCALRVPYNTGVLTSYWRASNRFSLNNFWFGAWRVNSITATGSGTAANSFFWRFLDSSNVVRLRLIATTTAQGANTPWLLQKVNAVGTATNLLSTSTGFANNNTLQKIDMFVNYSTSGRIQIYASKVLILDYSGDVTTDGVTNLAGFDLGLSMVYGNTFNSEDWSEVVVSDTDTRSLTLNRLPINGAGALSQWTGTASGTTVSETTMSTADGIDTGTSGNIELFTHSAGNLSYVRAVALSAVTQTVAGQPQNLQGVLRFGSTNYATSNQASPTAAFDTRQFIYNTDPSGGGFVASSIGAMQIGVEAQT